MSTKRATWIEGTTKSNRILRDLSEILTSANRNDEGIAKEENWELVYPRPFNEYNIERGTLLQDPVDTRHYVPVIDRKELTTLYDGVSVSLTHKDVILSTLSVQSEDLSKTYEINKDFSFKEETREISRLEGSSFATSAKLSVSYGTRVAQILDSVPVLIEKELQEPNPDRPIDGSEYIIDYTTNRVEFISEPPADAAYFALTFTDIKGEWGRAKQELLQLEKDLLDPSGHTFKLPASAKQIGEVNKVLVDGSLAHELVAAQSTSSTTGLSLTGSGIVYEIKHDAITSPTIATIKFTNGAPVLDETQQLVLRAHEYDDFVTKSSWTQKDFVLIKDSSEEGDVYKVVGLAQGLHITLGTRVVVFTKIEEPVLYKHLSSLHAGFEVLPPESFTVKNGNADKSSEPLVMTFMDVPENLKMTFFAREVDDLSVGIDKIVDRVVLKTITEPEQKFESLIENSYGDADREESLEMFVEIRKPARLVNPETGLERYVDHKGVTIETQENNHYIEARMFDKWDDEFQKAADPRYDNLGGVEEKGANISEWAKYSWFQDWKEYLVDELDGDSGMSNVSDGVVFKEVEVKGMNEEFPIQFWISTNNNRAAIILMGDPTLDQDNFLTSFGYLGRIHPFFDKECVVKRDEAGALMLDGSGNPIIEEKRTYFQNDVAGNFAMTVGSSTLPVRVGTAPSGQAFIESTQLAVDEAGIPITGRLYDFTAYGYAVTYLTDSGESRPTSLSDVNSKNIIQLGKNNGGNVPTAGSANRIRFTIPNEATGYRIYRNHKANASSINSSNHSDYKLLQSVTRYEGARTIDFIDDGSILAMEEGVYDVTSESTVYKIVNDTKHGVYSKISPMVSSSRSFAAVTRDVYTGAMLDVKFPDRWGTETATGVSDIAMFKTRSGLKFQKHVASFITTEEFIKKEKSGQSRWTGKFHLSPIYIEHSYDKQRGWLDGVMAVDDPGITHLDDLIINRDTPSEEVYKFFRINAPYSLFNNSANYCYGVAIIKSSLLW